MITQKFKSIKFHNHYTDILVNVIIPCILHLWGRPHGWPKRAGCHRVYNDF